MNCYRIVETPGLNRPGPHYEIEEFKRTGLFLGFWDWIAVFDSLE